MSLSLLLALVVIGIVLAASVNGILGAAVLLVAVVLLLLNARSRSGDARRT